MLDSKQPSNEQPDQNLEEGKLLYQRAQELGAEGKFAEAAEVYKKLDKLKQKIQPSEDSENKNYLQEAYDRQEYAFKKPSDQISSEESVEEMRERIEKDIERAKADARPPEEFESLRRLGMYSALTEYHSLPEFKVGLELAGANSADAQLILDHENSHASKAEILGALVRYQLNFVKFPDEIKVLPEVAFKYPPLSSPAEREMILRATTSAPDKLSDGDIEQLGLKDVPPEKRFKYSKSGNERVELGDIENNSYKGFDPSQFDMPPYEPKPLPELTPEEKLAEKEKWEKFSVRSKEVRKEIKKYVEKLTQRQEKLQAEVNSEKEFLGKVYREGLADDQVERAQEVLEKLESIVAEYEAIVEDLRRIVREKQETRWEDNEYAFKASWVEAVSDSGIQSEITEESNWVKYLRDNLKGSLNDKLDPPEKKNIFDS